MALFSIVGRSKIFNLDRVSDDCTGQEKKRARISVAQKLPKQ